MTEIQAVPDTPPPPPIPSYWPTGLCAWLAPYKPTCRSEAVEWRLAPSGARWIPVCDGHKR